MDDPWSNAWSEPTTTSPAAAAPGYSSASVFPPRDVDDEEDITIPSWEAPIGSQWADSQNSLWGARSPALDKFPSWHSPYDDLPLGKPSPLPPAPSDLPEVPSEEDEEEPEEVASEPSPEPELVLEPPAEPPFEPPLPSPIVRPISPPASPSGSPDAFGTFESGLNDLPSTSDPWTPSRPAFVPDSADSAWGAGWEPSDVEEHEEDAPVAAVDEWEAARQQKAMQDKHVPPELLASILLQFTELATELYPPLPIPTPDPDDYRANRHKGLNGFDSLNPTVVRLLPTDLTLPPPLPFLKSATAKHTSDALRLSRSAAFVRFSPLGHYSATKGSTAWEASVKRRPEPVGDADLLPPGWRVVEPKAKDEAAVDKKKPGHGGLLSFFGRRAGAPPVVAGEGATPRSASPASGSSPRASMDSVKSPTSSNKSPTSATPSAAVSTAVSPIVSSSTPPPPPVVPVASQTSDAGADANPGTPTAAPSAVSRFLGRFGRKAPAATGPQNMALSEGDFDFLADIEGTAAGPSLGGDANAHFPIMGALLDEPVPLPAKLAPPPRPSVAVITSQKTGEKGRPVIDHEADVPIFGTYSPPPSIKPSTPPIAHSVSTPVPLSPTMPPVDSNIDFSAWGFDEEDKSGGVVRRDSEPVVVARPPAKQMVNTRAVTNARGVPPPRRAPTAIMSSGSSKPAVVPKLDATFGFPPPPRTQTQTPILPPPPGTKATTAVSLFDDEDDFSDFHAPAQIPPPKSSANSFYDAGFSSSTSSERGLFSATSSTSIPANLFDDFDDFMQSPHEPATLRTPSPPRPPAKPGRVLSPPPASLSFAQADDDTPLALIAHGSNPSLASKRAAHQRTLSLVESAAASSGVRWPAPASPLPEALAPPPDQSDPFDFGGSRMQSQQAAFLDESPPRFMETAPIRALSPPAPSPMLARTPSGAQKLSIHFPPPPSATPIRAFSPPAPSPVLSRPPSGAQKVQAHFPPPPSAATPVRAFSPPILPPPSVGFTQKAPLPPSMATGQRPPALPTPLSLNSAPPGKASGGLSAQDLSFFEGL
ncbi:hypothetical protein C8R44DRAFT_730847 [Mycena epipterygia]|nr:hypothetical protein C8R44DRAFT_730847 [Mycena epipterygia]